MPRDGFICSPEDDVRTMTRGARGERSCFEHDAWGGVGEKGAAIKSSARLFYDRVSGRLAVCMSALTRSLVVCSSKVTSASLSEGESSPESSSNR